MKKLLCLLLCLALLCSAASISAGAETAPPADVSRDGEITLEDAVRIFGALSGQFTLTACETALADSNRSGAVDIADAVRAFYHVAEVEGVLPEAVPFTAEYMDVSDGTPLFDEPQILHDRSEYNQFADPHEDVSYYTWLSHSFSFTDQVIIAVPMAQVGYVASVSVQNDVLHIATVTASHPYIRHTAYAFVAVDAQAVEGKELCVTNYHDDSGKEADPTQTVKHSLSGGPSSLSCTMNADGESATLCLSVEMSSLGYEITDLSYISTKDALIVIYDMVVPHRTHWVFDAFETITATMTVAAGDYTGQPIVLYERNRECYEPVIGSKMPFEVVYEQDFLCSQPAENSVELITSLEQLEQVYAEDTSYAPDYTEGFTADYFEDHALILVKAYAPNLPESVTIDGLGISGETITVSILYTFREYYQPMLYHGRILLEINSADSEDIETIRCQSHTETI